MKIWLEFQPSSAEREDALYEDKAISNDGMVVEQFSSYFESVVKSLNIPPRNLTLGDATNLSNPVEIAIKKFENHHIVQIKKEHTCVGKEFDFEQVSIDDILKKVKNLDKKNGIFSNILSNRLK